MRFKIFAESTICRRSCASQRLMVPGNRSASTDKQSSTVSRVKAKNPWPRPMLRRLTLKFLLRYHNQHNRVIHSHRARAGRNKETETRRYEKEQKTRKRHPDIFYDFVLSEISPAQLNLFTFNRGGFVFSSFFFFAKNKFTPFGVLRASLPRAGCCTRDSNSIQSRICQTKVFA
jgi:hypothetical protein